MEEKFSVIFYDEDEKEIGRKTYTGSYGGMIHNAKRRGKKIGAVCFWHVQYLRRFEIDQDN